MKAFSRTNKRKQGSQASGPVLITESEHEVSSSTMSDKLVSLLGHALETGIGLLEKELKEKTQKLKDQEDEVKKAKEVISELKSLREDFRKLSLEKERAVGDLADLEKEKVKSDTLLSEKTKLLEVAEEKLAAKQKDRKEESDHLKAEITFQYEQGFEKAIDQVKFLHLEINVDEAGAFKEVRDGQLVDIPDEE
ncbi:hypothetical protein SESBI_29014 [Sesbania bispinosa]|nr:hypothetical protein SESBI_29014 [Sesbania bispinosa]